MSTTLIRNARIINEGHSFMGSVLIHDERIEAIYDREIPPAVTADRVIDATGLWLLPGAIDDHVHFREPGLTQKGDIASESRAAVAGGVTSFMDMPNTKPQTTTVEQLEWKLQRGAETSAANYAFFFGDTNDNASEVDKLDRSRIPGLKLFLGSSTGNMLINDPDSLRRLFSESGLLIAVHAEKEETIHRNRAQLMAQYGDHLDLSFHNRIRSVEACYEASAEAVEMATRCGTRLHILHVSTEKELSLFRNDLPVAEKRITGEACVNYLWFSDNDYDRYGSMIKCNPALKSLRDREALRRAVNEDLLDNIATDHAPHLMADKQGDCLTAASGTPSIQHSLISMMELSKQGLFTPEKIVEKMSHNPALMYHIDRRGFIRSGYYADLVLVDPEASWTVDKSNILYKCGWSPFEGQSFHCAVKTTFVNGAPVYDNGRIDEQTRGRALRFLI